MTGTELRERRTKLKLTQVELAKHLGITANTVARWERGEMAIPPYLSLSIEAVETKLSKNKRL